MKRKKFDKKRTIKKKIELKQDAEFFSTSKGIHREKKMNSNATERLKKRVYGDDSKKKTKVNGKFINIVTNKTIVDYDVVIIIPTKDRYEYLCNILNKIFYQKTKYSFKIIVLNDHSDDIRYERIPEKYSNIIYLLNDSNNSKYKYWITINKLLAEANKYLFRYLIQIDDDFDLNDRFIDGVVNEYITAKNNDNRVISVHFNNNHIEKKRWGCGESWVDGGGLYDYNFLYNINFKIDEISLKRWNIKKTISSGVWQQISKKINKMGFLVHKPNKPLIKEILCETQMQKT